MFEFAGVLFLFGLTWAFFLFTFSLRETFQILFTVLNSLQGCFILICQCSSYSQKDMEVTSVKPVKPTPETQSSTLPSNTLPRQGMLQRIHMTIKLELKESQFSSGKFPSWICWYCMISQALWINDINKSNIILQNQSPNDQQWSGSEQEDPAREAT